MGWAAVKEIHGRRRVLLGPQASYQWEHDPKHLLFVLARYKHAARLIGDARTVLEVGCGEGIGAGILAQGRLSYRGVDTDVEALDVARGIAPSEAATFALADATSMPQGRAFDAAVSLDVIEHIARSDEDAFVAGMARNLGDSGAGVIGTPNETARPYQSAASAAGHVNLYTGDRLEALMRRHFRHVTVFGMNDEVLTTGFLPMAHYLMALGVAPRRDGELR
jgi:2-polyprenyl-3-methyl-5-hydroxy-6-metoxy-1,4-benzoquinol methylase